ncbi:hypothetical protein N9O95_03760 [Alphaproteobacteria bacterium]|nr:hypothetical protein [Alphaproteobacteria bacterium]
MTEANGKLYFSADDGINGEELWVTDGTSSGTVMLEDINVGSGSSTPIYGLDMAELNGKVYFGANDDINGVELWVHG